MGTNEIAKKIRMHTVCKRIIIMALIIDMCLFIIGFFWGRNQTFTIVTYLLMLMIVVIAYLYPLNIALSKNMSTKDYPGILEYLGNISNEISNQQYFDGLIMIKNSLDEIVHYKMGNAEQYVKDNIWYLQGKFHLVDKKNSISLDLYNRTYVRDICLELQRQMGNRTFDTKVLESIKCSDEQDVSSKKRIEAQHICNFILVGLVLYKIWVSVNTSAYDTMNNDVAKRLVYNVGADIVAVAVIIINYWKTKKKQQ